MKKIFSILLIAMLTMLLVISCTSKEDDAGDSSSGGSASFEVPDDLRGGEIIVYSPFPDEEILALSEPFTEQTDIKVSNIVISTGEALSRLKAEAANPQADFWLSVRAAVAQEAIQNDPPLIIEYKPSTLDQISAQYQFKDSKFVTGVGMYPLVVFYNADVLAEDGLDVPETYDDLLDPQYKGKIVMPHPATSGTAYSAISLFLQTKGEEKGWEYILDLAENVDQFTRSGRAPHRLVAQGEYPIGIGFYDAVFNMNAEGFNLTPIFPAPVFADPYTAAVVKGAPNEAKAKLFFDYLLTADAQKVLLDYGNYSVRDDIAPPKDGKPLTELEVAEYDWAHWGDVKSDVLDKFIEETQVQPPEKKK
ncbi:MAG TPA: extracellular solute-binding protein [Anaerolineae bacterium]|nr:extracellular solute-binding protein [Anaerolineae bacterium]